MIILREKVFASWNPAKIISNFGIKNPSTKPMSNFQTGKSIQTFGNSLEEKNNKQRNESAKQSMNIFGNNNTANQSTSRSWPAKLLNGRSITGLSNTESGGKQTFLKDFGSNLFNSGNNQTTNSMNNPSNFASTTNPSTTKNNTVGAGSMNGGTGKKSYTSPTTQGKTGLELAADLKLQPQFNTWDKIGAMGRAFMAGATDTYDYATRNALDRLNENAYRRGMTRALNNYIANKAASTTNTQSY